MAAHRGGLSLPSGATAGTRARCGTGPAG